MGRLLAIYRSWTLGVGRWAFFKAASDLGDCFVHR
jgi:hypothetical protein